MILKMRTALAVCLIAIAGTQTGCITLSSFMGQSQSPSLDTSLLKAQGYSIPPGGMPTQVSADPEGRPRVVLEIRSGEEDQRHVESIPLSMDEPMFVEDVVQQAQLHNRLGKLNISIMRPNGPTQPPVRLQLSTDSNGKATSMGGNYALLPGDHIVVLEDNRSSLEKFISSQLMGK